MRKYKVESAVWVAVPLKPEIIEADSITAAISSVLFHVYDDSAECGIRTIAIRMNCNVTEVIE